MEPFEDEKQKQESLIEEAINSILLDIVIRGHGDRLIGRWSRLERVQGFLEQVPYMLDRINQLHLACMRAELNEAHQDDPSHHHRHHIHHVHHHHSQKRPNYTCTSTPLAASSLHDFVNLIGNEYHWLVRTRDTIGLTPLHKAVLFNNRPIVEYILDRYPDELAAASAHTRATSPSKSPTSVSPIKSPSKTLASLPARLIDAQDKYGRTALHYAAAALGSETRANQSQTSGVSSNVSAHLYGFLLAKGASTSVRDFRGKTAAQYLQHPKQARAKNVIHLANKLNASYQANVLSRTLRAASKFQLNPILSVKQIDAINDCDQGDDDDIDSDEVGSVIEVDCEDIMSRRRRERLSAGKLHSQRESMSVSCNDLRDTDGRCKRTSEQQCRKQQVVVRETSMPESSQTLTAADNATDGNGEHEIDDEGAGYSSFEDSQLQLKQLISDRSARPVLDANTKQTIARALHDATLERINELIVDGYGSCLLAEAPTTCWSQKCKRHIERNVPSLLDRTDKLHESIAANDFLAFKTMIQTEPQLARIRRPYKRALMSSIHVAAAYNRLAIVQHLVDRFPELVNQRDSREATCLHWAARSLRSDRLYCWLVDNYGSQLEHLRDSRNKLAADYRQAAIRMRTNEQLSTVVMSTSGSGGLAECDAMPPINQRRVVGGKDPNVESILRGVQREADGLHFEVSKSSMNKRSPNALRSPPKSPSRSTPIARVRTSSEKSPLPERKLRQTADTEKKEKDSSVLNEPVKSEHQSVNEPTQVKQVEEPIAPSNHQVAQSQRPETDLTDELPKVDLSDLDDKSKLANGSDQYVRELRRSTMGSLAADGHCELDNLIKNCIIANEFNKLEHIVLAGWGQRVLDVSKHLLEPSSMVQQPSKGSVCGNGLQPDSVRASDRMRRYIEVRVPDCMRSIETVHRCMHNECYAFAWTSLATDESGQTRSKSEPTSAGSLIERSQPIEGIGEQLNASFHKFCNLLLAQKTLAMGRDSFGATPLHVALIRTDKRLIDYLLRCYPEIASAPDNDERNALHYAAIVASAQQCHGIIQVTKAATSERAKGYWLVDENAKLVLDQLRNRYEDELGDVRDVSERTYKDYLRSNKIHPLDERTVATEIPFETDTLRPASVLEQCCGEFATLLQRYNYVVRLPLMAEKQLQNETQEMVDEVFSVGDARPDEPVPYGIEPNSSGVSRKGSSKSTGGISTETRRKRMTRTRSSDATKSPGDSLLNEGDLFVPGSSVALGASAVAARQVAPKPTVGCEFGFPVMSPTQLDAVHDDDQQVSDEAVVVASNGRLKHHKSAIKGPVAATKVASPSPPPKLGLPEVHGNSSAHHRRHRKHHNHNAADYPQQSIVGGVIVPTIIHNDKMDEIETYDIIYRQPSASSTVPQGTTKDRSPTHHHHHHHHHHGSLQLSDSPVPQPSKPVSPFDKADTLVKHHRAHQNHGTDLKGSKSPEDNVLVEMSRKVNEPSLSDSTQSDCDSDSTTCNSESSESDDEDEKRVERLSNEFETRVKREKNELKARVDQIMNEIKLSAKSSKSSRFLSSPNDLSAIDKNDKSEPEKMDSSTPTRKTRLSLGSSGHSSAHTSADTTTPSTCSSPSISSKSSTCSGCSKTSLGTHSTTMSDGDNNSVTVTRLSGTSGSSTTCSSSNKKSKSKAEKSKSKQSTLMQNQAEAPIHIEVKSQQLASTKQPPRVIVSQQQQQQLRKQDVNLNQNTKLAAAISPTAQSFIGETKLQTCKNTYGQTYLHFIASRLQSASTFYRVLDHGSHLIGERDVFYRTARDVAVQFNLPYNVQTLDKYVIDLFIGCNTNLLWTLLLQGYSPLIHVGDADGNDIMLILKLLKLDRMIHFLLQMADFQRWRDELHTFIRHGYSAGVSELITKHKDLVKAKSVHARTSLHLAILFDRIDMIDELIDKDPSCVHCLDNMGRTPLHYTYGLNLQHAEEIRDKLLAREASLQTRDVRMRTPKYYYIFKREIEEIRRIELELN